LVFIDNIETIFGRSTIMAKRHYLAVLRYGHDPNQVIKVELKKINGADEPRDWISWSRWTKGRKVENLGNTPVDAMPEVRKLIKKYLNR